MAIGASEFIMIVRMQNQASAAMARVSNDLRRMSAARGLDARDTQLRNKAAAQALRIQQTANTLGSKSIAMTRASLQIENQKAAVIDRSMNLEVRRAAIVARANQLIAREAALRNRIAGLEEKSVGFETQKLRLQQQQAVTQRRIQSLQPGGVGRQQSLLARYRAVTGVRQAELSRDVARDRLRRLRALEGVTPRQLEFQERRVDIGNRQVNAARRAHAIASLQTKELDAAIKELQGTEKIQENQLKQLALRTEGLKRAEQELQGQIVRIQDSWNSLSARERAVQSQEAQHARQLAELELRLKGVAAQAMEAAAAEKILQSQLGMTNAEIAANNEAMATARTERIRSGARAVGHAGRVASMAGLVGLGVMGAAAISAARFSTQSTLAATQARPVGMGAGASAQIAIKLNDVILKQMQKFPAASQDMADSLYNIFSSTNIQNIRQASDMLTVFNEMAVAGGTDLKTMTDAGISMYNNFPTAFKDMRTAGNAFFATVRYGRMNAEQFANSLSSVLPIAKQAGLTFYDVADAMALLTRQSGARYTRNDAIGIAQLIRLLGRRESVQGLRSMGVEVKDLTTGGMRPLLDIITDINKRAHPRGLAALNFFKDVTQRGGSTRGYTGPIQAQRAFANLVQNIKEYHTVAQLIGRDNNELTMSFDAMSKTPGVRWQVFLNQLKSLVIVIGTQAIPAFITLAQPVFALMHWFNSLSNHTKGLIARFAVFGSAAALVVGTLATLAAGLLSVIFSIRLFFMLRTVTGLMAGFGAAEGIVAGESGALSVGLAAVVGQLLLLVAAGTAAYYITSKLGGKQLGGWIGNQIYDAFGPGPVNTKTGNMSASTIAQVRRQYRGMRRRGETSAEAVRAIGLLHPDLQRHDIEVFVGSLNKSKKAAQEAAKATAKVMPKPQEIKTAAAIYNTTVTPTFKQLFATLKKAKAEVDKDPTNIKAQMAYQTALSNLAMYSSNNQVAAAKRAVNAQKNAAAQTKQTLKQATDALRQMYDSAVQQNEQAMGEIFNGPWVTSAVVQNRLAWSQKLTPHDLMKDMRMQVHAFERWQSSLGSLRGKLPAGLVDQLQKAGAGKDQQERLNALNRMTPGMLRQYGSMWQRGQNDIHNASMRDLKRQLNQYHRHGKNIAQAIINGIQSENPALERVFRGMIENMMPGITGSPHRRRHAAVVAHPTTEHHVHTHIHAEPPKGTAVSTWIRKQHFRQRTSSHHLPTPWDVGGATW